MQQCACLPLEWLCLMDCSHLLKWDLQKNRWVDRFSALKMQFWTDVWTKPWIKTRSFYWMCLTELHIDRCLWSMAVSGTSLRQIQMKRWKAHNSEWIGLFQKERTLILYWLKQIDHSFRKKYGYRNHTAIRLAQRYQKSNLCQENRESWMRDLFVTANGWTQKLIFQSWSMQKWKYWG